MKIALVSDTHVPASLPRLPDRLLEKLVGVDAILHAGDLVTLEVLGAIAPTTAVVGNMDPPEVTRRLNTQETLKLGGRTIAKRLGSHLYSWCFVAVCRYGKCLSRQTSWRDLASSSLQWALFLP